jgi:MATE family multidrug resistance protein
VLAYHGLGPWAPMASPVPFWAASALALVITAGFFVLMLWIAIRPAARGGAAGWQEK